MAINHKNPLQHFQLRPFKAAKVSEISEATVSSAVPEEERVNFHIGHPVQDEQLISLYQHLVLGIKDSSNRFANLDIQRVIEDRVWEKGQIEHIKLICRAIEHSVPYMPRGGFARNNPGRLAHLFLKWLTQHQQEPLEYDLGKESGRREIIFTSGGIWELLRVFFHGLSHYLSNLPARILLWQTDLPDHLNHFEGLQIHPLPPDERSALQSLESVFQKDPLIPTFLLLGNLISETLRRSLYWLSQEHSLFFVEINDTPNHLSLAREAGLSDRVLRILTPSAIDRRFSGVSIVLIAGNADFIKMIETVHFELKGTPASTEIDLLTFLLQEKFNKSIHKKSDQGSTLSSLVSTNRDSSLKGSIAHFNKKLGIINKVEQIAESKTAIAEDLISPLLKWADQITQKLHKFPRFPIALADPFAGILRNEFIAAFFDNTDNVAWQHDLEQAFLSSFLSHHPQYSPDNCLVVSGSARTAMSLLGFHCDIRQVIAPDLSWTYEHCFPEVEIVPLTNDLSLDSDAIMRTVEKKLHVDPNWHKTSAVVLNNPHNASGRIFDNKEITRLLKWLLERSIFVIDDLTYQNVAPSSILKGPNTLRQIVNQLIRNGFLRASQGQYLITVHSLSKTDCFAGARLSVVEILHPQLLEKFRTLNSTIRPNIMAIFLAYLFYRNNQEAVQSFWALRNQILEERMKALETAQRNLPTERNPFGIVIYRPEGSMYPRLVIERLPEGISLDWLASGLAKRGIGLIPLSTFARTARGFDLARKTFRLTLGGTDDAEPLSRKMRRVLIDLNRMIAEESTNYSRKTLGVKSVRRQPVRYLANAKNQWKQFSQGLVSSISRKNQERLLSQFGFGSDSTVMAKKFLNQYLPERMKVFDQQFHDRLKLAEVIISEAMAGQNFSLIEILERELYKESLEERTENFRHRLFDRTVHPTQMYGLKVDVTLAQIIDDILQGRVIHSEKLRHLSEELTAEFLGINVPIRSHEEGDELVSDLRAMIEAEEWALCNYHVPLPTLLSFWGDWDRSIRPSGQGHRLTAAALLENVTQLSHFLKTLTRIVSSIDTEPSFFKEIHRLEKSNLTFWNLLNKITSLTNQLEKRYLRVLPFDALLGKWRQIGMRLHLAREPVKALWQHNDRLERKMLKLRMTRRENLEYYFSLNKRLRKTLYQNLDLIYNNLNHPELALCAGFYRSILRRFVLTPRIHQRMILASDQFALDTTVYNIMEINELSGKYGNPGTVMAIQVSFSTDPEAFISLERKLRTRREEILRNNSETSIPKVWMIPLFEDIETVLNIDSYLNRLWEYAVQSRQLDQQTAGRFSEMVCELFISGSDISQQVCQSAGAALYKDAKHHAIRWLADKGLVGKIRIKLGSGEPMQRQGGYYDPNSGRSPLIQSKSADERLTKNLSASTKRSSQFARSPLRGVLSGGEFRTFQSNIAEQLRRLSLNERTELLYHVQQSQKYYENELNRAAESQAETRLSFQERGLQELEILTRGAQDKLYDEFIALVTRYYQQILYGREEDVVGIHVISYFISRATPPLRDRPEARPNRETSDEHGQRVVERLAQTLPLSRYGSLLRAIGHNRAQTMILGINQLSTGLFRALGEFAEMQHTYSDRISLISERILPNLPVQDILHTLRIYHDPTLLYIKKLETAYPAGDSAFLVLREDNDSINNFIRILQKEFLRRQGLDVSEFFNGDKIIGPLLSALRPDIAVLLQSNLFNTELDQLLSLTGDKVEELWLQQMENLLKLPLRVQKWREKIWQLIETPIRLQVESFVELALAINKLAGGKKRAEAPFVAETIQAKRLGIKIANLLRGVMDDSMRQLLIAAVQYLTQVQQQMEKVPIEVIRALRDVERIVHIEEQPLGKREQDLLRFYILQIARLCGENG